MTDTVSDGDDPWWAVAATQVHAHNLASREDKPSTSAPEPKSSATPQRRSMIDGEFVPLAPTTLADSGISESQIEGLILKYLLHAGTASGRDISDQLKLPFPLILELLRRMKAEQLIGYKSSDAINDYIHQLTPVGVERTRRYSEVCTYFGAAPVSLADYIAAVPQQSLRRQQPTHDHLRRALADLVISRELFGQLGQALFGGTAMFLYGDPGNGKTTIAERVTAAFGPYVWIPRCLSVWGEVVRLYDPSVHEAAPCLEPVEGVKIDRRWVRIKRPTIVAGGELTAHHLEMTASDATGIIEAPLHLKSNGGTLVIDDFGRQRIGTRELLNRWIVPLEKGVDYLSLPPSGRKIQVPFDQLVIFATNLEPRDLVDEAFLRRIPYKIEVRDPSEEEFRELMRIMASKLGVDYREGPIEYLIVKHYQERSRRFRYCHPRDLLLQVRNFCLFHEQRPTLTNEAIDAAAHNYFSIMSC